MPTRRGTGPTSSPLVRYRARVLVADGPAQIAREIVRTDSDPEGVGIMTRKGSTLLVRLEGVPLKASPLLKQEMLASGADSAHAKGVADHTVSDTAVVLIGNPAQYHRVIPKLRRQPFRLAEIGSAIESALANYASRTPRSVKGLHRSLTVGDRTRVMGILNVTPDSFYDGGLFTEPELAVHHALHMEREGADLIDIGGESTRPGATPVPARVELGRLLPVLDRLHDRLRVPISVDTRKAEVARAALDHGADLVNDVGGLREAPMRRLLARTGAPAVVMHMRGTPRTMQRNLAYDDLRGEVYAFLADMTLRAERDGIAHDRLLIDPGLGFGKSGAHNLELLAHLREFRSLGYPLVVGASRKSFLGAALGGAPPSARGEAGAAAAVIASMNGADVVRVHDVGPTVRALAVADAVRRGRFEPPGAPEIGGPPSR